MDRIRVTPGTLYRMLSREFRERRSAYCAQCVMPMVLQHAEMPAVGCNWFMDAAWPICPSCQEVAAAVVGRYAPLYDVVAVEMDEEPAPGGASKAVSAFQAALAGFRLGSRIEANASGAYDVIVTAIPITRTKRGNVVLRAAAQTKARAHQEVQRLMEEMRLVLLALAASDEAMPI